ncbi:MAG: hypothetical protein IJA30_06395 [Bacilli bacterium]|nr:hypothetical protein [Bacilli bacterium]
MSDVELLLTLKKVIAVGMTILVLGCAVTTFIISKCNIIRKRKNQEISLIYKVDYKTSY